MKRLLSMLILLPIAEALWCDTNEPSAGERKRPLDLPAGGGGPQEDEDAPESIHFFGGTYEGDGFFFLLDVSGSMYGVRLVLLKEEFARSIASLSQASEFGAVAFSDWVRAFSHRPVRATRQQKRQAAAWVDELRAIGTTHMLAGARTLLPIAHRSKKRHRIIIAVGDGLPTDPDPQETLVAIVSENVRRIPWNTILIGSSNAAVEFMSSLSNLTGGVYRHIED